MKNIFTILFLVGAAALLWFVCNNAFLDEEADDANSTEPNSTTAK